jgi:hypothetical protein
MTRLAISFDPLEVIIRAIKGKGKFTLKEAMKVQRGSRSIALLFL